MSASNVCPACGAANSPTNLFCINCGTRLAGPPVAPPMGATQGPPPPSAPPPSGP